MPHRKLVKGDSKSAAVAAASVIAKVTRDRYMARAGASTPATVSKATRATPATAHRDAIRELGPSPIHRLSFDSDAYGLRRRSRRPPEVQKAFSMWS